MPEEFTPTHRLIPAPIEALQLQFDNIEKVADFLGSPAFALSNPTGEKLVATYQVEGYRHDFVVPLGNWVLRSDTGRLATISTETFIDNYEAIPKEIKK